MIKFLQNYICTSLNCKITLVVSILLLVLGVFIIKDVKAEYRNYDDIHSNINAIIIFNQINEYRIEVKTFQYLYLGYLTKNVTENELNKFVTKVANTITTNISPINNRGLSKSKIVIGLKSINLNALTYIISYKNYSSNTYTDYLSLLEKVEISYDNLLSNLYGDIYSHVTTIDNTIYNTLIRSSIYYGLTSFYVNRSILIYLYGNSKNISNEFLYLITSTLKYQWNPSMDLTAYISGVSNVPNLSIFRLGIQNILNKYSSIYENAIGSNIDSFALWFDNGLQHLSAANIIDPIHFNYQSIFNTLSKDTINIYKISLESIDDIFNTISISYFIGLNHLIDILILYLSTFIVVILISLIIVRLSLCFIETFKEESLRITHLLSITPNLIVDDIDVKNFIKKYKYYIDNRDVDKELSSILSVINNTIMVYINTIKREVLLRLTMKNSFLNLARKNQSLLNKQMYHIEALEKDEKISARLKHLFAIDHANVRINRNLENIVVLFDKLVSKYYNHIPLSELIRVSICEVYDYERVKLDIEDTILIKSYFILNLIHLISELLDNALYYSETDSEVTVKLFLNKNNNRDKYKYIICISDKGIGIDDSKLFEYNQLLISAPDIYLSAINTMGLYVVSNLSKKLDSYVELQNANQGVNAYIYLNDEILTEDIESVQNLETDIKSITAEIKPKYIKKIVEEKKEEIIESKPDKINIPANKNPIIDDSVFDFLNDYQTTSLDNSDALIDDDTSIFMNVKDTLNFSNNSLKKDSNKIKEDKDLIPNVDSYKLPKRNKNTDKAANNNKKNNIDLSVDWKIDPEVYKKKMGSYQKNMNLLDEND